MAIAMLGALLVFRGRGKGIAICLAAIRPGVGLVAYAEAVE